MLHARGSSPFTVWIDIENPPQVQYLLPFRRAFDAAGLRTVVTARDYGSTLAMLESAGVDAEVFGALVGRGKLRKALAATRRAQQLWNYFAELGRPDALLTASRAAAVAAWRLRIPSFVINDYEHVFVRSYRFTGSTILFPDVIDPAHFRRQGLRAQQLVPFKGLKEDLTFAELDIDAIEPYDLGPVPENAVRVLCRPPAETSHYYQKASTTMTRTTLAWLAQAGALVVFSPRDPGQAALLEGLPWRHQPITLTRPVPFVSLLKSIDAVVCSGGTMLREAAYLGIPAYSIFQSKIGAVDRWLQSIGRAKLILGPEQVPSIALQPRGSLSRLASNPHLLEQIVELVAGRAGARRPEPAYVA